jgi:hypothetical protein
VQDREDIFSGKYNDFSVCPLKCNPLFILKCSSTTCAELLSYWRCIKKYIPCWYLPHRLHSVPQNVNAVRIITSAYSNIVIYIEKDTALHSLCYLENALHVSGDTYTHHQERKQLYLQHLVFVTPLLLPAAIAAGSSNGVTNTRCCRYCCLRSWLWVAVPPEICRAVSR